MVTFAKPLWSCHLTSSSFSAHCPLLYLKKRRRKKNRRKDGGREGGGEQKRAREHFKSTHLDEMSGWSDLVALNASSDRGCFSTVT